MAIVGRWRRLYTRSGKAVGWIKAALPMACCMLCRAIVPATRLRTHYDRSDCLDGQRHKAPWCIIHRWQMSALRLEPGMFRCWHCFDEEIRHQNFLAIEKGRAEALKAGHPQRAPFWQPDNRNPVVPLYVGGRARTIELIPDDDKRSD
jgi:hypothetical protein